MKERLIALQDWINAELLPVHGRAYVDTGAVLERELAARAGLGWFGRNTMMINPGLGSYFFLSALLVEIDLEPDAPFTSDRCGTCARCVEACPTGARVFGNVLDAGSEIRWVLENKRVFVLKQELGTKPRFFYFFDK